MPTDPRHTTVLDIDAQQVGAVYAKALLSATEKGGQTENVIEEFDSFLEDVLDKQPKFETVLASGVVPADELPAVIDRAFAKVASPLFLNFLKVVAGHGRLNYLRAIHQSLQEQFNQLRGKVEVHVTTATELDDAMANLITRSLRSIVGTQPVIHRHRDPELIGGVVVQVGDTVYDGSVARQFQQLRSQLIDRSVHEIQNRRTELVSEET